MFGFGFLARVMHRIRGPTLALALASRGSITMPLLLPSPLLTCLCPTVQAQVQEMHSIREKVYQMEQAQMAFKQK